MKESLQQHEREMLERNDQLKSFSANLAHELKTPLSVMQLLVDGEEMGLENPTFLADLDQQLATMNDLVKNILSYSQQMKEDLPLAPLELRALIEQEVAQQQVFDSNFRIELEIENCEIRTNEQLLRMILVNLLTNGMKYSLNNRLKIRGNIRGEWYQLVFENKTTVFSDQQFSHLADPFVVGEDSRNNRLSGTGLGLSIVKEALKTLGGGLLLNQENDRFIATITIPL